VDRQAEAAILPGNDGRITWAHRPRPAGAVGWQGTEAHLRPRKWLAGPIDDAPRDQGVGWGCERFGSSLRKSWLEWGVVPCGPDLVGDRPRERRCRARA
jgi:hypothetical protein